MTLDHSFPRSQRRLPDPNYQTFMDFPPTERKRHPGRRIRIPNLYPINLKVQDGRMDTWLITIGDRFCPLSRVVGPLPKWAKWLINGGLNLTLQIYIATQALRYASVCMRECLAPPPKKSQLYQDTKTAFLENKHIP